MLPYASVVVPSHDRAATLPSALASIRRQTVENIEVIVVGDGATPEVAAIAKAVAAADARVRFLSFPKAPRSGAVNRDLGLAASSSDRIFYCDDDDVWLPRHVEMLGPQLDQFDVVDSLSVSVGALPVGGAGRLHAALVNSASPHARELLARNRLKLIYDTHLAHRKSRYHALGNPYASAEDDPAAYFLAALAGSDSVRWRTLPTTTALSLHGAARIGASPRERKAEIEGWLERTRSWSPGDLLRQVDFTWHLTRAVLTEPPSTEDGVADYLERFGIDWKETASHTRADSAVSVAPPLEARQRHAIELTFELLQGKAVESDATAEVVTQLLDVVLGSVISVDFAIRALRPLGASTALAIVRRLQREQPRTCHLTALLEAHLLLETARVDEASAIADRLMEEPRLPGYDRTRLLARIELAEGQIDAAVRRMASAWESAPDAVVIGLELAAMLIEAGRREQALAVCRRLDQRIPRHAWLAMLYQQLGEQPARGAANGTPAIRPSPPTCVESR